ncbi:antitermination protein NusB [Mycobacterium paragordonae]|uniref:Antitermination protein NusB n=1 Tax=Mycobacterium paragordonae TaxID=1389713 RepID=A0AAJ1S1F0_9MYCO|nr:MULTISPECIES: antitermination protein NusB [Mycobacterium]AYE95479.1 antitermination protein NusB [Mycobacterium paragordonae]MDP7735508.1 antitermination protein NusB [Mycobacterium paragordonae]OBJ91821.1 antitermination protein NusB [Mycobacterium gordonae]OBK51036.1 antitermination protein NusB [Mycobacterium gordonae]TDK92685.1 antitermination protein NusB [Mycobacterium paragordonae]
MTRLELRVVLAVLAAVTVVVGAVISAAFGWTILASVLAIFGLGVGAAVYHTVERLILARRISTVRTAAKPLQPLLPVMAAIMGLTQGVVRSLGDVTDLPGRRFELPQLPLFKWMENPLSKGNRQIIDSDDELDG